MRIVFLFQKENMMTTWIVIEDGHSETHETMVKLFRDGELLGRMNSLESEMYVLTNGSPEDVYTEKYRDGTSATVTVQYLLDSEAKRQKFLAEREAQGD